MASFKCFLLLALLVVVLTLRLGEGLVCYSCVEIAGRNDSQKCQQLQGTFPGSEQCTLFFEDLPCMSYSFTNEQNATLYIRMCSSGFDCGLNPPLAGYPLRYCRICSTSLCNNEDIP